MATKQPLQSDGRCLNRQGQGGHSSAQPPAPHHQATEQPYTLKPHGKRDWTQNFFWYRGWNRPPRTVACGCRTTSESPTDTLLRRSLSCLGELQIHLAPAQ